MSKTTPNLQMCCCSGGWTSCYPDHLEIKTIVKIVSKLKISEEILQIRSPICIVWLYTITSTNTRNPTNTVTNVYCMTLHDNKYKHRDKQIIRNYRRWNNSMTSMLLVGLFETKRNLIGNKIKYFWFTNVYMSYKIRALNK